MASPSFADLGISDKVVKTLSQRKIKKPFAIQALVMADALAGRDVLAKSRTGSGKTLAFALPIVEMIHPKASKPAALVLVPTRELAVQVRDEFRDIARVKNLKVTAVYGGTKVREQGRRAVGAHILIATPGRLDDLVNRKMLSLQHVGILILDEADRMLDMGFQPQVDAIVRRISKNRQTMFFSATLDGAVGNLARAYTRDAALHEVQSEMQTVDEAKHRFIPVSHEIKLPTLARLLQEDDGTTLVFVSTKVGADVLVAQLKGVHVEAVALHGDMTQSARGQALKRFSEGGVRVLIATDVAARGLDLEGITQVINYDPPENHNSYVHRVGRTARAGRSGVGVTLVLPIERTDVSMIARVLDLGDEFEADGMSLVRPRTLYSSGRGRRSPNAMRRRRVRR